MLHGKVLQTTMSEGLPQGIYVVARVGFEPATFWMQGAEPTTMPRKPCPINHLI